MRHIAGTAGESEIAVTVSDTGTGIAPDFLPHAFERYAHHDPERTGLGLSICREIVEAHHGSIEIESVLGHTNGKTALTRMC